jgi:hypothetical protein
MEPIPCDEEYPPGRLRAMLDETPEMVEQLNSARIVVSFFLKGGDVDCLYGRKLYAAEGGLATVAEIGRCEAGVSDRNSEFPPGTWVVGIDPDTDDPEVLVELVWRVKGRIEWDSAEARGRAERN